MILEDDHSAVTIRPKHYVGSSRSVWASDSVVLRWKHPSLFEIECLSIEPVLRTYTAMVWDHLFYFVDTTEQDNIKCVTGNPVCPFREYESLRIEHALSGIVRVSVLLDENKERIEPEQIIVCERIRKE